MNTSKQVNVMIGLLFVAFIGFAAYFVYENPRADAARERQIETHARRGAELYVLNCANCHGVSGMGPEEGALYPRLNREAFLIIGPDDPRGWPETPLGEADEVREFLFNTIACGRAGTHMPVWLERYGGPMSHTQVNYIVTMVTEGRWDLVEREWAAYAREQGYQPDQYAEQFMFSADEVAVLPPTTDNCGQYSPQTRSEILARAPGVDPTEPTPTPDPNDVPPDEDLVQGLPPGQFYAQNCAACHGPNRGGTAVAPALTPADLTESFEHYVGIVADGVPGTAMPSWRAFGLTDEEIERMVEYIMQVEP